jgi:hypothetical protein
MILRSDTPSNVVRLQIYELCLHLLVRGFLLCHGMQNIVPCTDNMRAQFVLVDFKALLSGGFVALHTWQNCG